MPSRLMRAHNRCHRLVDMGTNRWAAWVLGAKPPCLPLAGLAAHILHLLDHDTADPLETAHATAATDPTQPAATLSFSRMHFAI